MGLNQKQHNKHILFLKVEMTLQLDFLGTFSEKVHLNLNMNDTKGLLLCDVTELYEDPLTPFNFRHGPSQKTQSSTQPLSMT